MAEEPKGIHPIDKDRLVKSAEMIAKAKRRGAETLIQVAKACAEGTKDSPELMSNLASYVSHNPGVQQRDIQLIALGYHLGAERIAEMMEEALPVFFNEEQEHAYMVDDIDRRLKETGLTLNRLPK